VIDRLDREAYGRVLPSICSLFERSFGRTIPATTLSWRYLARPEEELLVRVARDGADIAANYSASPVTLELDGRPFPAALSMTTMTDPRYAGRGLFTRLANSLYEDMAASGYVCVFGFPNRNSQPAFVARLGWSVIYEVPTMIWQGGAVPPPNRGGWAVVRDDSFEAIDYAAFGAARLIHVRKDAAYLRWRYAAHPTNRYRNYLLTEDGASSFCVVKPYGEEACDIVDLQAHSPDHAAKLMAAVLGDARDEGRTRAHAWGPRHHFVHRALGDAGFVNDAPITYFGGRPLAAGLIPSVTLTNYSAWYVQMGDSDVY
jgi:GNAT superfamily N-acetyltransferase